MGVETPIPPIAMDARRPEGRPAAGIFTVEKIITDFYGSGANTLFMCVSIEQFFLNFAVTAVPAPEELQKKIRYPGRI